MFYNCKKILEIQQHWGQLWNHSSRKSEDAIITGISPLIHPDQTFGVPMVFEYIFFLLFDGDMKSNVSKTVRLIIAQVCVYRYTYYLFMYVSMVYDVRLKFHSSLTSVYICGEIFPLIGSRQLEEPPIRGDSRAPFFTPFAAARVRQIRTFKTLIEIRLVGT